MLLSVVTRIRKSFKDSKLNRIVNPPNTFFTLITGLEGRLDAAVDKPMDFSNLDMAEWAHQFNAYLEETVAKLEDNNFWGHKPESSSNLLAQFYSPGNESGMDMGYAFVAQYRESTILRRLYKIDPSTGNTCRFRPYENALKNYKEALTRSDEGFNIFWLLTSDLFTQANAIFSSLLTLKNIPLDKVESEFSEFFPQTVNTLKMQIKQFNENHEKLETLFLTEAKDPPLEFNSNFFYPMSDEILNQMEGTQLLTICLEELYSDPSPLLLQIISNETLWKKIEDAIKDNEEDIGNRRDAASEKITALYNLRAGVVDFFLIYERLKQASNLEEKILLFAKLEKALPLPFQLHKFREIIKYAELENNFLEAKEQYDEAEDKKIAFISLQTIYLTLPEKLQADYAGIFNQSLEEIWENQINKPNNFQSDYKAWAEFFNDLHVRALITLPLTHPVIALHKFYIAALNWHANPILERQMTAVDAAFQNLTPEYQQALSAKHQKMQIRTLCQKLIDNQMLDRALAGKIDQVLSKFPGDSNIQNVAIKNLMDICRDNILFNAMKQSALTQFTLPQIQDLLVLKNFYDKKLELNKDNKLGSAFSSSLAKFYEEAAAIRLSNLSDKQQVEGMIKVAQQQFEHRHKIRRILADILMLISTLFAGLGLVIGVVRQYQGKTFFFSHTPTDREADFIKLLRSPSDEDQSTLFSVPRIIN
jgi:hypothetical protein